MSSIEANILRLEQKVYVRGFPYSRYEAPKPFAMDVIDRYIGFQVPGNILLADIGGFHDNPVLANTFPGIKTVSVNLPKEIEYHHREGDVSYDGFRLPFPDESIPVVISVDVFQQVQPMNRMRLLREMMRVAHGSVIISCPFSCVSNDNAEEFLLEDMVNAGLPEKASLKRQHKIKPTLKELAHMARSTGYPFDIYPATNRDMDFLSLKDQVEVLSELKEGEELPSDKQIEIAEQLAISADKKLRLAARPPWRDAYRAVLVIDKNPQGYILDTEGDYSYGENERDAYTAALAQYHGFIENPFLYNLENETKGLVVALEGPDGSGKTDALALLANIFAQWGYIVATPMSYGPRQALRELEKIDGILMEPAAREAALVNATNQSMIAAIAHSLRGPRYISFMDRTLASTHIYHTYHKLEKPVSLVLRKTHIVPPDLTFVLQVTDFEENMRRKMAKGDLANAQITEEDLRIQRDLYKKLHPSSFTGEVACVSSDGSVEDTAWRIIREIERLRDWSLARCVTGY